MSYRIYRMFNKDNVLLYVGCTTNLPNRIAMHDGKPWFDEVSSITVSNFGDKESQLVEESRAIYDEEPLYNIKGAREPDKQRAIVYGHLLKRLTFEWVTFTQPEHEFYAASLRMMENVGIAEKQEGKYWTWRLKRPDGSKPLELL